MRLINEEEKYICMLILNKRGIVSFDSDNYKLMDGHWIARWDEKLGEVVFEDGDLVFEIKIIYSGNVEERIDSSELIEMRRLHKIDSLLGGIKSD